MGRMAEADDAVNPYEDLSLHLRKGGLLFRTLVKTVHHSGLLDPLGFAQQLESGIALRVPNYDRDLGVHLQIRQGAGTEPFRNRNPGMTLGLNLARCGYMREPLIVRCGDECNPYTACEADGSFKDLRFHMRFLRLRCAGEYAFTGGDSVAVEIFGDKFPIDKVIEKSLDICLSPVLVIQVVGMFP